MNVYITRHGQTRLNKMEVMQGRTDEPLDETGIKQAEEVRDKLKDIKFDAVYTSPLCRAVKTASIVSGLPEDELIKDERIIEVTFGKYELRGYRNLGIPLTLYWALPEVFPAPKSVESVKSMVARSRSFIDELKTKDYENVLIVCHGGIIRALCGVIENRFRGIKWRPRPLNCEIRQYKL